MNYISNYRDVHIDAEYTYAEQYIQINTYIHISETFTKLHWVSN